MEWHGQEDVEPFQEAKDKDWKKLKSSRLYIFISVIQDHIESLGKPILLKGDEVLLNGLLAQSAYAPKPSITFSYPHMSQTKIQTRPH